jgi:hypothetical protein
MLETGTSGLMSGEGKRVGSPVGSDLAPFLDSTALLQDLENPLMANSTCASHTGRNTMNALATVWYQSLDNPVSASGMSHNVCLRLLVHVATRSSTHDKETLLCQRSLSALAPP